jgi:hypothetical protein
MTKQEIIYDILTIATKSSYTDDSLLSERYIGYKVDEKRAKEIHDSYKRNFLIDPKWVQDFGFTKTTEINIADSNELDPTANISLLQLDCKLKKVTLPPVVYITNPMSSANNLGVYNIRSLDSQQEFYFKPYTELMNIYKLSSNHPARKFRYYTQLGNSIYIPDGPEYIHPFLILERPLDGFIINSETPKQDELIIGQTYFVKSGMITHNSINYMQGQYFVAANINYTGLGIITLANQKRQITEWDEYPMSSTMAETVIIKILTMELKIEQSEIAQIRNNSQDELKVLQSHHE